MATRDPYKALRRHLDSLPVGFPGGGPGMRILRRLFEPDDARIALGLDWRFRGVAEIAAALESANIHKYDDISARLDGMASKGIVLRRAAEGTYALMPFIIGMFELQVGRLSRGLVEDTGAYLYRGYGLELLTTGEAQTRVIPVGAAIKPEHRVASYEEFREIIRAADGHIAVVPCVCRRAADLAGRPCASTERRELCITFRDFADTVVREGWGRPIDTEEALAIAAENEREGLVMRPSNEEEPQFLCGCCGDCCGLLAVVKAMRRPADFVSANFRSAIDTGACTGCGACARRCPMDAVIMVDGKGRTRRNAGLSGRRPTKARISEARCIGCGVCVAACRFGAARLERVGERRPPKDTPALLGRLAETRPSYARKVWMGLRGILGLRVRIR